MKLIHIIGNDISQIIPIIHHFKKKVKKHIFVCNTDEANICRAEHLLNGVKKYAKNRKLNLQLSIEQINENALNTLEDQFKHLHSDASCLLNITDAYPMLTLKLTEIAHKHGTQVISYDHFNNLLHTIEKDGNITCTTLSSKLKIDDYITLLNYTIVSQSKAKSLKPHKEDVLYMFEHFKRFKQLRLALLNKAKDFHYSSYKDILRLLSKRNIVQGFKLVLSTQKVLQGDLFEEYIFWLVHTLKVDDIAMGVKVDFDGKANEKLAQRRIHNEFDILLTHNNRLYTIECKYSKRLEGLEIIYKYDAVLDYFGETSKAMIVNLSSKPKGPYLEMKSSSNFRHSTLRRARLAGISVYHESVINKKKLLAQVQSFFHLGGEDEDR